VIDRSTANNSNPKEGLGRTCVRCVHGLFNSALSNAWKDITYVGRTSMIEAILTAAHYCERAAAS
jgi:hypothetical protein